MGEGHFILGRRSSRCKGPEACAGVACLGNRKAAGVAGAVRERGRVIGDGGRN